jgi:pyruvate/2-oxoglutarate dehydrogenase complex dihydrolipoamide acyltransferase (E2) component
MPSPIYVPRVNNNDDQVRIVRFAAERGARISVGDVLAEIETDKSVNVVESEQGGVILKLVGAPGDMVTVGAVLAWIGEPGEAIPDLPATAQMASSTMSPTAKARQLLERYGLSAEDVPASGERLSAADVERYVHERGVARGAVAPARDRGTLAAPIGLPDGTSHAMTPEQRGMVQTVSWHRAEAVPGYLEITYDPELWTAYAAAYTAEQRLLMPPLLGLMAHRLVRLAAAHPRVNTTIVGDASYRYTHVNLGLTVQAGETLMLAVVREAETKDTAAFIAAVGEVQRKAMTRRLQSAEASGCTLAFSSMARWGVRRHMPVLPPYCSIMVAHTAASTDGTAVLGATYDHRVLTGADVVQVLQALSKPEVT